MLREVLRSKRIARSQIASATGLTMGAVSRITQELLDAGLLCSVGATAPVGKPGPRFVELAAARDGGYVVAVDIETSVQHALIIDLAGNVVLRDRLDFLRAGAQKASIQRLGREVEKLIARAGVDRTRIFGTGVVTVGVVNPSDGIVLDSPIAGWRGIEIGQPLSQMLGMPVRVDSLLNALNLAEYRYGLSRGRRSAVLVHTTLGIGASLLVDGVVVRGQGMQAGQIAHARIPDASMRCVCGARGCLTTVASGYAVLRLLKRTNLKNIAAGGDIVRHLVMLNRVLEAADRGDTATSDMVFNAGRALGTFLSTVVALFRPEVILFAGRLGTNRVYINGARQALSACLPNGLTQALSAASMGGENAAALLAIEELVCSRPLEIERFASRQPLQPAA